MTVELSTVLVIGDRGQLGSEIMHSAAHLSTAKHLKLQRGSDHGLDVGDKTSCLQILTQVQPDIIVNAAAYTAVDAAEQDQKKAFLINADAPGYLAQWCHQNGAYLIHISTDYVFSGKKSLYTAYNEDDSPDPLSVYGQSKLQGENNIQQIMPSRYAILRTAWLYGFYGNNFLKTMLKLNTMDAAKSYKVVNDQFGSPSSTFALSQQIFLLIEKYINYEQGDHSLAELFGVFHATSSDYCSWYQLACEFLALMGREHNLVPCTTEEYPTPATRPQNSILENRRLDQLAINSFVSWQQDLERFVARYRTEL